MAVKMSIPVPAAYPLRCFCISSSNIRYSLPNHPNEATIRQVFTEIIVVK